MLCLSHPAAPQFSCAEITIVMCYFQLCAEDYHWWWRSFFTSGASALYLFAYSAFYFFTKLEMTKFVSAMIYFGYMGIISVSVRACRVGVVLALPAHAMAPHLAVLPFHRRGRILGVLLGHALDLREH